MIVVTGAAGFIGSCVVSRLNQEGRDDLILVDHLDGGLKQKNLDGKRYKKYFDKAEFRSLIQNGSFREDVSCIIHMGACSSTTLQDAQYFEDNNFRYTRLLAQWALARNARFIYASSAATYGDGAAGYKDDDETVRRCKPLNLYGESKQKFDEWVLDNGLAGKVVGLKFFNVFGPNEYHKGDMRSVVAKSYANVVGEGVMRLFKSTHSGYSDGGQKRDFIYVKDAVEIVMFFLNNPGINGIYNVGTGKARTWNDLALALFSAAGIKPRIEYIDMPASLAARYQNYTQADMGKLRAAGYARPFTPLEDAVNDYVRYLKDGSYF